MPKSRKERNDAKRFKEGMRAAGLLAFDLLEEVAAIIQPGVSPMDIDRLVDKLTSDAGAVSAPFGYHGFPAHCCTSINDVVCHGIPDDKPLREGDIINVDVTPKLRGYHGDSSRTFTVGFVIDPYLKLIQTARECMEIGIAATFPGCPISLVGKAIQPHAQEKGFSVVREYTGHFIGKTFHKDPPIPSVIVTVHPRRGTAEPTIEIGDAFTVEPMLNFGKQEVRAPESDGWTVRTNDGSVSAQWEHTVLMTHEGPEILTTRTQV